jgi:hypothetical protein
VTFPLRRASRPAALVFAALVAVVAAACSSGTPTSASSSGSSGASSSRGVYDYTDPAGEARSVHVDPTDSAGASLPPRSLKGLEAQFGERVNALGVRLTRGAVVQLPTGPHLQLYVEPPGPATPAEYIGRIVALARAIGPDAFATWSGIATFDVCQEPPPGVDDAPEPAPETVLFMTREQVQQLPWDTATLAQLRRLIADTKGGELNVSERLAGDPAWTATNP